MKTSSNIQSFLNENNPEKLKEFVGLFNPAEPEIISQYRDIFDKFNISYNLKTNENIDSYSDVKIDQNLLSVLSCNNNNAFVLHKFNNDVKILYNGYDTKNECSGELHFFVNKLFLASFSYPKLINGSRIQFLKNISGNIDKHLSNEYISLLDDNHNIILIENGAVLKVHYFNKDTLESLHQ